MNITVWQAELMSQDYLFIFCLEKQQFNQYPHLQTLKYQHKSYVQEKKINYLQAQN